MTAPLVSRAFIAQLADDAAAAWVAHPKGRPTNPFCADMEPEHYREWEASFSRALLAHSAVEGCEVSA